MLLLVNLPDEEYKRIVKAPRAVTPNEAFNQRIKLLNVIKKAKPVNDDFANFEKLSAEHSKQCKLNCYYCGYHKWDKEKATTYCELIRNFGKPKEYKQGGTT